MIRVHKPDESPRILRDSGVTLTAELCRLADSGEPLSFDRDVYGAAEVKQALRAAQHDKCCFCESKLGHAQFGDVEHYRPKAGAHQSATDPPARGYYWLAYTWENLYLSCEVCNRRHKRSLFPLANPDRRVPAAEAEAVPAAEAEAEAVAEAVAVAVAEAVAAPAAEAAAVPAAGRQTIAANAQRRGGGSLTSIQYRPSRVTASENCRKSTGLRT